MALGKVDSRILWAIAFWVCQAVKHCFARARMATISEQASITRFIRSVSNCWEIEREVSGSGGMAA